MCKLSSPRSLRVWRSCEEAERQGRIAAAKEHGARGWKKMKTFHSETLNTIEIYLTYTNQILNRQKTSQFFSKNWDIPILFSPSATFVMSLFHLPLLKLSRLGCRMETFKALLVMWKSSLWLDKLVRLQSSESPSCIHHLYKWYDMEWYVIVWMYWYMHGIIG